VEEVRAPAELGRGSAIDLGREVRSARPGSDSGIDLEAKPISDRPVVAKGDSGIDLVEEDIVRQANDPASGTGSGRDLIAEKRESGVDLDNEKKGPAGDSSQGVVLDESRPDDHSSSVDLGSIAEPPVFADSNRPPRPGAEPPAKEAPAAKGAGKRKPLTS